MNLRSNGLSPAESHRAALRQIPSPRPRVDQEQKKFLLERAMHFSSLPSSLRGGAPAACPQLYHIGRARHHFSQDWGLPPSNGRWHNLLLARSCLGLISGCLWKRLCLRLCHHTRDAKAFTLQTHKAAVSLPNIYIYIYIYIYRLSPLLPSSTPLGLLDQTVGCLWIDMTCV